ncbi:MAG: moleuclar chaperone Hap20 [Thermodesulfovibrio sp. RBG_19FT_COMBO_42_12]|nr:MAG: moleuclar chaperone Hap20 [Thermodesulfovibrio sp. RBG_19FT_COMBO_42_12]
MAKEKAKETKAVATVEPPRWPSSFQEMERLFEDFLRRPFSLIGPSWWPRLRTPEFEEITPSIDLFTEGDDVVVKAELPGMKKEDIDVSVTDNTITVSGEKKQEEKVEKKDYYRLERSYGSFTRSFELPAEVQTDKASANFKDGVLEIRIPKTEGARKKEKRISID